MSFSAATFPLKDYEALTTRCGVGILSGLSMVTLTGLERQSFLHNMCTNDIRSLGTGSGCEAFLTDVKGKIVAHLVALVSESELRLLSVPTQAERIISHLDRYIIREDVQLCDASGAWTWLVCAGAKAEETLSEVTSGESDRVSSPWQSCDCNLTGINTTVLCCQALWPGGFLVGCAAESSEMVLDALRRGGGRICSAAAWEALRVESGLPRFGVDFDEANLPQEVDRNEQSINFHKGCYLGQETIARIDALGHVNRKIVSIEFTSSAKVVDATPLFMGDQQVGAVTSSSWSPRQKAPLALAMVRRGANDPGIELTSDVGPATIKSPSHYGRG